MARNFEAETKKAIKTCRNLIEQRDNAKSKTLHDILEKEIAAFVELSNSFNEYAELLQSKLKENLERRSGIVKEVLKFTDSISNPFVAINLIEHTKKTFEESVLFDNVNELIYEQAIEIYLFAISRDYKDWERILKSVLENIGEIATDIATNFNSIISIIYSAMDKSKTFITLIKQYQGKDTDYKKIDRELLIIEIHTEIMKNTTNTFRECSETLKRNKEEK